MFGNTYTYPPNTPIEKFRTMLDAWFLPWWMPLLAVLAALLLIVGGFWAGRRNGAGIPVRVRATTAATVAGLANYLGWWSLSSDLPLWVRHPAPGIFAFVPILAAVAVWGARMLWRADLRPAGAAVRGGVAVAVGVIGLTAAAGDVLHAQRPFMPQETLAAQRAVVEPIRE
ncbi:hypothetical protein [Microbacterium sp. EF45047]|nr:hypothetical protein [Microbacterium sp. EF45047]WCM56057.1 hypothetical protein JRG78_02155 [Microbacterium sp. EF45047]